MWRRAAGGTVALLLVLGGCTQPAADVEVADRERGGSAAAATTDPAAGAIAGERGPVRPPPRRAPGVVAAEDGGTAPGRAVPRPLEVEVPAIGVRAALVGVGLAADGAMEVPAFGMAGWYQNGPRPGASGPAVIVAHYDSRRGPDVFFDLHALVAGDEIHVHRADGSTATFVVVDLAQHPKDELPGDRIWASSHNPRLTLVTCGGEFDRATGHYADNVIVYAVGVGETARDGHLR